MRSIASIAALVGALALASSARAGTIASPAITVGNGGTVICTVANLGDTAILMQVPTVFRSDGSSAGAFSTCGGAFPRTLPPHQSCSIGASADPTVGTRLQFNITFTGSAKKFRGLCNGTTPGGGFPEIVAEMR
ncbi:MAG TPA: hypothetical protein VFD92_08980 [Candidatus Binatia bacterium]|nr:hypothetical protein [Candidatus Binatia bacterium]